MIEKVRIIGYIVGEATSSSLELLVDYMMMDKDCSLF
jgi:hypothetical protein